jgi:uncharacterized protein YeaO (DUF488 family)
LRKWVHADPKRWPEFRRRYCAELKAHSEAVASLKARLAEGRVTLLFGAKNAEHNNAVALAEYLRRK